MLPNLFLAAEGGAANEVVQTTSGAIGIAWLIPVVPLVGFCLVLLAARRLREGTAFIATGAAIVSFVLSVLVFLQVAFDPATHVRPLFTWIAAGPLEVSWTLLVDQLTAVMLLVVTGVGALIHVYSFGYMHGDERYERFFAYLNLFLFSMLVLVLGSNLLTLFVGWELVGLSSYLLIGFWFEKREYAAAAKKAFITNRVGDVSYMVAMFLAFATFGTLDFVTVDGGGVLQQAGTASAGVAMALGLLLMGGAAAKSAQIPLYVWLPDAMAGPTPVSALIHAATMVTAGVYLTVRSSAILVQSLDAMTVIAWIGAGTALLAALIAIRQDDIKKILAYSTVSQLGFMFMAVGTGGFSEGIFHLVTHAFFKGLLFLAAGSVMHAMANRTDAWKMGGLAKVMPITFWTSAVAWLAISGFPGLSGFFSKDQLLTTAYEHGFTGIWAVGVLTAVLTAFYMSRWFFLIFLGEPRWTAGERIVERRSEPAVERRSEPAVERRSERVVERRSEPTIDPHAGGAGARVPAEDATGPTPSSQDAHTTRLHPHESPTSMTVPLVVLAVLSAIGGAALNFTHSGPFTRWLSPVVASTEEVGFAEHGPLTEPMLIAISIVAALLGIGIAFAMYGPRRDLSTGAMAEPVRGPVAELMERKFFVDEAYEAVFVRFGGWVATRLVAFDQRGIDGLVNGAGRLTSTGSRVVRRTQTGLLRGYAGGFVLGAVVLAGIVLVQVTR